MKSAVGPWLVSILLIAPVVFVTLHLHRPPDVISADAPVSEFSAARAFEHLKILAVEPHPVGSPAHDRARDYILNHLTNLGLQPEVQIVERRGRDTGEPFKLQNILARLAGTESNGGTLLLMAHYDTVPQSPGASDDGSGVATLLEVLRALKSSPPPKHNVMFLFSDGEEMGLLGSRAFAETPLARDVSLVLNFEARGSDGPVFMFETGDNNQWFIEQFGKVVPFPFANSIYEEVYKSLPNNTDFTVFKNRGVPGFNFAYINGLENYHSENDNLSTIDPASLQHQGSYGLALARSLDLPQATQGNAVFFDALGMFFISYPQAFVIPIALTLVLLLGAVVIVGIKRRRLSLGWSMLGLLVFLISIASSLFLTTSIGLGLGFALRQITLHREALPLLIGIAALNIALITVIYQSAAKYCSFTNLSAGTLIGWLLCAVAVSFYYPGISYIFQWPLLAVMAVFAFNVNVVSGRASWLLPVATNCVGAIPGLVLFTWTAQGLFQAVGVRWPFLISIGVMALVSMLLPLLEFLGRVYNWLVPSVFLLISIIAFVIALT
jgi:hypothetical protein